MITVKRNNGFTLIELMIVIAIASVLLTIGVPAMTSMIRGNELKSSRSTVLNTLAYSRGESAARREQVIVCSSIDGLTCSGATDWSNGWIIFRDLNTDNALTIADCDPASECLLRVQDALPDQVAFNSPGTFLGYTDIGTRVVDGLSSFRLCAGDAEAADDSSRSFTFNITDAGLNRISGGTVSCP